MTKDTDTLQNSISASQARKSPFVSYAQNFEDVMLYRALGHVSEGQYLDIGAGEPDADSVTLAFYKANWRGINVEPLSGPFSRLSKQRPLDTNLNCAVGSSIGEAILYVVGAESGLSTLDPQFAMKYVSEGWSIEERRVQVTTLADLCCSYVKDDIHFLKIDAEGAELDILKGADFSRWRPWVVLVEATLPNSRIPSHQTWEDILINNDYKFCYFDGLNRFYLAQEHASSLLPAFAVPPNVTDNFVVARMMQSSTGGLDANQQRLLHSAQERADEAQARVHAAQDAVDREQSRVAAAEARADHAQGIAHAAMAQVSALQVELRTVQQQLSETASSCDALRVTTSSLERNALAIRHELEQARFERDTWAQELFESNRFCAELVKERQVLLDRCAVSARHLATMDEHERLRLTESASLSTQVASLQHAEVTLKEKLEAITKEVEARVQEVIYFKGSFEAVLNSTSWLLTKPLRSLGRLVRH